MPNTYRELLARAIENNCGYYSRYSHYALEWNVALDFGVPDFDDLFDAALEAVDMEKEELVIGEDQLQTLREKWDSGTSQQRVWEYVQEDMWRSVTDDDTYRTFSPAIGRVYGMYPTDEDFYDCSFNLEGRSGKHLVLTEFEGRTFKQGSEDFAEAIRKDDCGNFPNKWCHKLLVMIKEWDKNFSRESVKADFMYQCSWQLGRLLEEAQEEAVAAAKESVEVQFWAERDVVTV